MSEKRHNQIAFLDPEGKIAELKEITQWIKESQHLFDACLQLQDDPDAPSSLPIMCTRGCLLWMKCIGDIFSTQIKKGDLSLRYKFLLHVLIQCISNRRAM
ncbi:hypothetical protein Hanom_Chr04g00317101 [Helianthus anomalus]